jgi:uncharacterized phage protein gp47/JayE
MPGVTPTGFVGRTRAEIQAELEEDWREEFGANVDLSPDSPDGQIIGIVADRIAELWEVGQAVYSAQDPDKAVGQAQDAVCAITGTQRDAAAKSTVDMTVTGTAGTVLPVGREVSVAATGDRFRTTAEATLVAVPARANSTFYALGARYTTGGNVYQCVDDGTSGVGTAPVGTAYDTLYVDGTTVFRFLGAGTAADDVEAESVEADAIAGAARTITVIETPVSGWDGAVNVADAMLGRAREEDDELRAKREAELAAAGGGTPAAITAAVLQVAGVISCKTYANNTASTDSEGRPPHSVEVVVEGGEDADIAAAIAANVSGGIRPYGSESVNVTDSQGLVWAIGFSRPDVLTIYVRVDVEKDPLVFPVDGEDQLVAAIIGDEGSYPIGKDVVSRRIVARCFDVPGVLDVSVAYISETDPPIAATTISVGERARADFDASRITVNLTDGTP